MRRAVLILIFFLFFLAEGAVTALPDVSGGDSNKGGNQVKGGKPVAHDSGGKGPDSRKQRIKKSNREFWESLTEKEKHEIRKLFKHLEESNRTPKSRKQFLERWRRMSSKDRAHAISNVKKEKRHWERLMHRLREMEKEFRRKHLPPELREKLEKIDNPRERRRIMEEHHDGKFGGKRREMIEKLPPEIRDKLNSMSPREQARFLRRYHGRQNFQKIFKTEKQRRKIFSIRPKEFRQLLGSDNGKARSEQDRPRVFDEASWEQWKNLKPFEKHRILKQIIRHKLKGRERPGMGRPGRGGPEDRTHPRGRPPHKRHPGGDRPEKPNRPFRD